MDATHTWECEFCNQRNALRLQDSWVPTKNDVECVDEATTVASESSKDVSIVFCVDVSKSMAVKKTVRGLHLPVIKGAGITPLSKPHQVSRLQCMQTAIVSQILAMSRDNPSQRMGLVTFNTNVTVVGDGTQTPVMITGEDLDDKDLLMANGISWADRHMGMPVAKTK